LLKQGGASRRVVRACLPGGYQPLIGAALFAEYENVLANPDDRIARRQA